MATYTLVTAADIEDACTAFRRPPDRRSLNPNQELWLDWTMAPLNNTGPRVGVRWYTSVVLANGGLGRSCGEDAMRVVILCAPGTSHEQLCVTLRRVHRVRGWREHLYERLVLAWRLLQSAPVCPACGARMVPRRVYVQGTKKIKRLFWGCSRYPNCNANRRNMAKSTDLAEMLESLGPRVGSRCVVPLTQQETK